ncbi:37S ribosomal protein S22 [Malassezia vespertilionis]|nr:37S ribosomal protein S22 [Malassezia vespertilionis]WFD05118.1 37S ribosomal protein S22 [Malassezia vespertilionis]
MEHCPSVQLRRDTHQLRLLTQSTRRDALTLPSALHFEKNLPEKRANAVYAATHLCARYAVLVRILDQVKRRILVSHGDYTPQKIIDWNCSAGDALWASVSVFGGPFAYASEAWSHSLLTMAVQYYRQATRKRADAWAEQLAQADISLRLRGDTPVHYGPTLPDADANSETLGINAFGLGALPSDEARGRQVLRMWKSDAAVLVLVEEATARGFACIAAARAQLMALSRDTDVPCHVVAPWPHDDPCILTHAGMQEGHKKPRNLPDMLAYTQMYYLPPSVRSSLHLKTDGHRLRQFCYLIVQKTPRPSVSNVAAKLGAQIRKDPVLVHAALDEMAAVSKRGILDTLRSGRRAAQVIEEVAQDAEISGAPGECADDAVQACVHALEATGFNADQALKLDAYQWPRILQTPLKKGGHVTMDAYMPSGAIQRFTVAKSSGRQAYQDARKARHGDLFPHYDLASTPNTLAPSVAEMRANAQTPVEPDLLIDAMLAAPNTDRAAHAQQILDAARRTMNTPKHNMERLPHAEAYAYQHLGPEAQHYARIGGSSVQPKSRYAPKRTGRTSRKPNRRVLDEEMQGWDT